MARIFYSMAGEGRGHATRVRSIVEALRHEHEIVIFAPGVAYDFLAECYPSQTNTNVKTYRIPGLLFQYRDRRLSYSRTVWSAGEYLMRYPGLVKRLEAEIRRAQPDLVITDFEPALPHAAKRCDVPFISLNHQHFLVVSDLSSLPWDLRLKARCSAPIVSAYYRGQAETIVSSFYFPPLRKQYQHTVMQIGVLLRPEIVAAQPIEQGHVLVYLRRFADENVMAALESLNRDVRVYGLGTRPARGRIQFCPVSDDAFLEDLRTCDALISNAGNQLVGEAMFLGKPVLAIPEQNNFEQYINAHFVRQSQAGDWLENRDVSTQTLGRFMNRLDEYREGIDRRRLYGNPQALAAIQNHLPGSGARRFDATPVSAATEGMNA